jgi:Fe-Mn family superoxide dismutase
MSSPNKQRIYELPDLPYARDALQPHISSETLDYHYDKHHRAYVKTLNKLITTSPLNGSSLEDIVAKADGPLFNAAAQAWNHAFYWNCLTPVRDQHPKDALADAIKAQFGSESALIEKFRESALGKFGSGWTWLVIDPNGKLLVENTDDADTPLRRNVTPLLTCDVWEHAYYIDYRNDRKRYVDGFLSLLNWSFVEKNFAAASAKITAQKK